MTNIRIYIYINNNSSSILTLPFDVYLSKIQTLLWCQKKNCFYYLDLFVEMVYDSFWKQQKKKDVVFKLFMCVAKIK